MTVLDRILRARRLRAGHSGPRASRGAETVAIIMDGNGRWAHRRGLPVAAGHRAGTAALRRTVEAAPDLGVRSLCVYAFSTENWARPDEEVADLMDLFAETIRDQFEDLHRQGVRIRFVGRRDRALRRLLAQMAGIEDAHRRQPAARPVGRVRLRRARRDRRGCRAIVREGVPADEIDADVLRAHLAAPELPDPDLVIRTSGERRISNFLLWQSAYAEYIFTPVLWPDFGPDALRDALAEYAGRRRRFGRR